MSGRTSKNKGSEYERNVCKQLSLWVSNGRREDVYWRSAMSGGRATFARRFRGKSYLQVGDISAIDPLGHLLLQLFSIECKHHRKLYMDMLLHGRMGQFRLLWEKPREEAFSIKREPLVVMKQNQRPSICLTTEKGAKMLLVGETEKLKAPCRATFPHYEVYVYLWRDVLMLNFDQIRKQFEDTGLKRKVPDPKLIKERLEDGSG